MSKKKNITQQPFLTELEQATKTSQVFLWESFLSPTEAAQVFQILDDDKKVPWDVQPHLFGELRKQQAFQFDRNGGIRGVQSQLQKYPALEVLEKLCRDIQLRYNVKVYDVFCNRFQDPSHRIEWHADTYGSHIFVLTLGSTRAIQFRRKPCWFLCGMGKRGEVETVKPNAGDIYFMPLQVNYSHHHRVCSASDDETGTRISLVFFVESPKYANRYRITKWDRIRGYWSELVEEL